LQILDSLATHDLAQSHLDVVALVAQTRIELIGILFTRIVEVQAEVRIYSNAKVVVHHEDLRVILVLGTA